MKNTDIICIASHKGGVGKTTTVATLGSILASSGERVLLVDLDAQRNLTSTFLGSKTKPEETLFEAMCGKCALPVIEVRENLSIVPSSLDMGALDTILASKIQRETVLKGLLRPVCNDYRWILLDCPSQMGIITVNALTAATSLIVPVSCDAYATEGLLQLIDLADVVSAGLNPRLDLDGIIVTRFHTRRTLDRIVEEDLRKQFPGMVFPTRIRENAKIVQAPVMHLDIFSYDSRCNGTVDYRNLMKEIRSRLDAVRGNVI